VQGICVTHFGDNDSCAPNSSPKSFSDGNVCESGTPNSAAAASHISRNVPYFGKTQTQQQQQQQQRLNDIVYAVLSLGFWLDLVAL
jgi:hypothetical protein